jgi:hypothetical protein
MPAAKILREEHQPIDEIIEKFIHCVTYSESNPSRQRLLHEQDAIARWFDVDDDSIQKRLRIYNRFTQLCETKNLTDNSGLNQHPSIVSFIGSTMAGKSSLIRAMLALSMMDLLKRATSSIPSKEARLETVSQLINSTEWGPVTRSSNLNDLIKPTTRGVNLYRGKSAVCLDDQKEGGAEERERILLFADCEGFNGGNQTTNSEAYGRLGMARQSYRARSPHYQTSQSSQSRRPSDEDVPDPDSEYHLEPAFDDELTAPSYSTQGKVGVELFYARFLYAVSNVIVYVIDRDGSVQSSLTELFGWASSAVFKSINNPSRKTLIIVRHKASLHKPELYDEERMRSAFLTDLSLLWEGEPRLKSFVDEYNSQQNLEHRKITRNDQLFRMFFDEVKCCYVPSYSEVKDHPEQLFNQYHQLGQQISQAVYKSEHSAMRSWTHYNIPTFTRVLNMAFKHFQTSDRPFDFYKASRSEYSNPKDTVDYFARFFKLFFGTETGLSQGQMSGFLTGAFTMALLTREIRSSLQGRMCKS